MCKIASTMPHPRSLFIFSLKADVERHEREVERKKRGTKHCVVGFTETMAIAIGRNTYIYIYIYLLYMYHLTTDVTDIFLFST